MLRKAVQTSLTTKLARGFYVSKSKYADLGETRLREIDPDRWEGVPITFKTNWRDEGGFSDIRTCIQVHDAIEREFGIDILDRCTLISDFELAYYVVMQSHDAV